MLAAKCGDPLDQLSLDDSELILVLNYTNPGPILEGNKINFTCMSGMELLGPNSITCMGNGEWEPNPREVECKGETEFYLGFKICGGKPSSTMQLLWVREGEN